MDLFGPELERNMDLDLDGDDWDDPAATYPQPTVEQPQYIDPRNGSLTTRNATSAATYGTWLGNQPATAPSFPIETDHDPFGPDSQLEVIIAAGIDHIPANTEIGTVARTYAEVAGAKGYARMDFEPMQVTPMTIPPVGITQMNSTRMHMAPVIITQPVGPNDHHLNVSSNMQAMSKSKRKSRERRAVSIVSSQNSSSMRTRHPPETIAALEAAFSRKAYLEPNEINALASQTNITPKQVTTWFNNRRSGRSEKKALNARRPEILPQQPSSFLQGADTMRSMARNNPGNELSSSLAGYRPTQAEKPASQGSHQYLMPPSPATMSVASQGSRVNRQYSASQSPSISDIASTSRGSRQGRRRYSHTGQQQGNARSEGRFRCGVCDGTFNSKYSQQRHENSQHWETDTYVCQGETAVESRTGSNFIYVTSDVCARLTEEKRTFYRKDGMKAHALKLHTRDGQKLDGKRDSDLIEDLLNKWRSGSEKIHGSQAGTCQFCGREFLDLDARCQHMADGPFTPGAANNNAIPDYGRIAIEERREPYVTGARIMGDAGAVIAHHNVADFDVGT